MTTFTKIIQSMNCVKQVDSMTDVVYQVVWTLAGTDESGNIASRALITTVPQPTSNFTPYDQLTQEQVMGWVNEFTPQDVLDAATKAIEDELLVFSTTVSPVLPWLQPPVT